MRKRHTLVGMEYDEAMRCALELAGQAAAAGDVPVGAVVLDAAGQIVGRGYNTREADGDPLAHAEIIAMRQAAQALGAWNLADCTLAVTLEPCPMCAGACIQTHIGTIAFGAWGSQARCMRFDLGIFRAIRISAIVLKCTAACWKASVSPS